MTARDRLISDTVRRRQARDLEARCAKLRQPRNHGEWLARSRKDHIGNLVDLLAIAGRMR